AVSTAVVSVPSRRSHPVVPRITAGAACVAEQLSFGAAVVPNGWRLPSDAGASAPPQGSGVVRRRGRPMPEIYDAVIIGSGAAGGMAAHVLTSHGLKVLLLEAGRKLPIEQELRSMQWPYDHPRRGEMPPDSHGLEPREY